jgi:hypothetical protein
MFALDRAALAVQVLEIDFRIAAAEQHQLLDRIGQAVEGRFDIELGEASEGLRRSQPRTAPPASDRCGLPTIFSGSKNSWVPRPSQVGHAPMGLLNENNRGSSSLKE